LTSYVDESFRTRGRGQWAALAPTTLLLRRRGGDAPLQDTGRYKQSYVTETDNQTFVEVGTNLKTESGLSLGKIHEFGTGPYTIRVKRAKVLAAQTRAGNWLIFGKQVNHPGIPARPVLPSKVVAERLVQQTIDGMLSRISAPSGGRFGEDPAVWRFNRRG
jgi:phage gpG-like protein